MVAAGQATMLSTALQPVQLKPHGEPHDLTPSSQATADGCAVEENFYTGMALTPAQQAELEEAEAAVAKHDAVQKGTGGMLDKLGADLMGRSK